MSDPTAPAIKRRRRTATNQRSILQAHLSIEWHTYDNDDLADDDDPNPRPDEGWYVYLEGHGSIGPDHFGPGYQSVDEALAAVEKWATDRGFNYAPPVIGVTVGKQVNP